MLLSNAPHPCSRPRTDVLTLCARWNGSYITVSKQDFSRNNHKLINER